jgi:hypothetical protein
MRDLIEKKEVSKRGRGGLRTFFVGGANPSTRQSVVEAICVDVVWKDEEKERGRRELALNR